ncbi:alpha/beta fold hydrolase [Stutzerimonas stutzeri]|jgi:2-hydroxy-6-oxonona-2,4-dienedioate hydrolase|uniref:alpha/beta fold hydrolase n=1 Tax=Stutzerimonas stutzeri TaxID=316 RepID=UPI0026595CCC|nr:alpha/beta fold hydrolase [Stutzerimonas stutzeri]MCF6782299.1 alpha/beta fold hydrolase [Stutzerimonas stutzeri]MCF6805379.1 alpha/beta fold hydrolase [Stutzerimonas stutzeri]
MSQYSESATSRFALIEDQGLSLNIHYHDCGEGEEVVVMLHGSGPGASGWSNFSRNVEPLAAAGYRVVLMDCPGWSKSDSIVCSDSRSALNARVLKGLLDHLGIARVHLIGNSMGGHSAVAFALEYPQCTDRLVLMGGGTGGVSPFVPMPTEGIKLLQKVYRDPTQENLQQMMDIFVHDAGDLTPELIAGRLENILKRRDHLENFTKSLAVNPRQFPDMSQRLGEITAPTLVIWGRNDRFVPMDTGLRLVAGIPNSELHLFNNCGHWVQWEHAERFNRLVADFLG